MELMPPKTSRDFQTAAAQRLNAAEILLRADVTLDAQYLGGYTVECSLKALILERTPDPDKAEKLKKITKSALMHRSDILLGELRDLETVVPPDLAKRIRSVNLEWTTSLRYERGRRDTEATRVFLDTVRDIFFWVESLLP